MEKKRAAEGIDFADSEYRSFSMSEDALLTIFMKNWQSRPLKLNFFNAIHFEYDLGDVPNGLYEVTGDSALLDKVVFGDYGYKPQQHPYKLFFLEDVYNVPFIKVVAESVEVIKGDFENV